MVHGAREGSHPLFDAFEARLPSMLLQARRHHGRTTTGTVRCRHDVREDRTRRVSGPESPLRARGRGPRLQNRRRHHAGREARSTSTAICLAWIAAAAAAAAAAVADTGLDVLCNNAGVMALLPTTSMESTSRCRPITCRTFFTARLPQHALAITCGLRRSGVRRTTRPARGWGLARRAKYLPGPNGGRLGGDSASM